MASNITFTSEEDSIALLLFDHRVGSYSIEL